jgi:multiple antibiotic resistance protein
MVRTLIEGFVTLLVIVDPIGNVPAFLAVTQGRGRRARRRLAVEAVIAGGGVLGVFAGLGREILSYLGISLAALQISGGLLLLIVALRLLSGRQEELAGDGAASVALVPLATPLIAGPGAIAAVLVFAGRLHGVVGKAGLAAIIVAVMVVLLAVLVFATEVARVLHEGGIALLSRVFGLLLAAIAVQLGASGVLAFAHAALR